MPLHLKSAVQIAEAIRGGKISAREALEHFLTRVDGLNGKINAIIFQDREGARRRADELDRTRRSGGPMGPLHGVPMTVKESFQIAGSPTTLGIPHFRDNVTARDALAVRRLTSAGANIFGKTNVPLGLGDFQSYNEIYGVTNNPWDLTRTPGGSSGGSAAALAAGLTGMEIGSDIGGSIRNPAHFCGVFGHKPTWGLLPPTGHSLDDSMASTDIAAIGPLARSAFDLEAALKVMAGPEEIDVSGQALNLPTLEGPISDLRIAVWASDPFCPTSQSVGARLQTVAEALGRSGVRIDDQARPPFTAEHSHEVFAALLASALGARLPDPAFEGQVQKATEGSRDPADSAWLQAHYQTLRHRDWAKYHEARVKLRWAWRRFFDDYDFLITPVMPVTAFPHDHRPEGARRVAIDGRDHPYFNQIFWAGLAGVAYLPATVFPSGAAEDGLPVGFQIIGPAYADLRTIGLAQRLEAMGFSFKAPPGYGL